MSDKNSTSSLSPAVICTFITIVAALGAFISLVTKSPLWVLFFLLPALIYESIRTQEGASTKFSSILLLILVIMEIILVIFGINFNLADYFGTTEKYIVGYELPLGDIKVFGPILTALLSTILIFRTYGTYTRWLSVVIAVGSLATVFIVDPLFFQQALKLIADGLFNRLNYAF